MIAAMTTMATGGDDDYNGDNTTGEGATGYDDDDDGDGDDDNDDDDDDDDDGDGR